MIKEERELFENCIRSGPVIMMGGPWYENVRNVILKLIFLT